MQYPITLIVSILLAFATSSLVYASDWQAVSGADTLQNYMSGATVERTLPNGDISKGEYFADGTGAVYEYGGSFPRTWQIKGQDQICIATSKDQVCFTLERNTHDASLYRGRNVLTDQYFEFYASEGMARPKELAKSPKQTGGAATASADEVAKELANPNTPLASLTFKLQLRGFEGDLPNADKQEGNLLLFQPAFPFPLDNGDVVLFRPAIPILLEQPVFDSAELDFDSEAGLGDIVFDLAYARTSDTGILSAIGLVSSLPTATNDLGTKRFTLGPELLIGKISKEYAIGAFPNHQWDIGGSGDVDINLTTLQLFATYLPGGGWNVGSVPIMSYDHNENEWTLPLNFQLGKTIIANGRPWKLSVEFNYYIEKPDAFGPEWMIGFNVAPVVKNAMADWFK